MFRFLAMIALVCGWGSAFPLMAQSSVSVETVVQGLANPTALTLQPETGILFVAENGKQRVVRVVDGATEEVLVGTPEVPADKRDRWGIQGLVFLDRELLFVMVQDPEKETGQLSAYKLSARTKTLKAKDALYHSKPRAEPPAAAAGNLRGAVLGGTRFFSLLEGTQGQDWLVTANIDDPDFTDLRLFKELTRQLAPRGITSLARSPFGFLTIAHAGDRSSVADSHLSFWEEDGKFLGSTAIPLWDVAALAYSPRRKRLFALDRRTDEPGRGGLFQIVQGANQQGAEAVRILDLNQPTAMAFDSQGNLYIALPGNPADAPNSPGGSIVKIMGLDEPTLPGPSPTK